MEAHSRYGAIGLSDFRRLEFDHGFGLVLG